VSRVLRFDEAAALDQAAVGGKGVNLARMAQAGLPVPPGFCVSTAAYREFLGGSDGGTLGERVAAVTATISADDRGELEGVAARIRDMIIAAPVPPAVAAEITEAYAALGGFVAVRSSGTAEDLAEASFAGQHDTYLEVLGAEPVVDAVKRCWASLWTERAIGYRRAHGFADDAVSIAVVVQRMVVAEVSGVMFTANPLTSATDEVVINASWGLGEALVQGMVTPDEVVVQTPTLTTPLRVIERTTGAKELRIVRDGDAGGVRTEGVATVDRDRDTLDDANALELAELGLRVQEFYGGFPQDVEWARADGEFLLLQARPITGVEFSWDADVDARCEQDDDPAAVWTRAFSDSIMNGIVTPSQYSTRFPQFSHRFFRKMHSDFGFTDLAAMRHHKFWKGEAYYNVRPEMEWIKRMVWPPMRPLFLDFVPPVWQQEVLEAPFDLGVFVGAMRHWHEVSPDTTPYGFPPVFRVWNTERTDADGLPYDRLRDMTDQQLAEYCRRIMAIEGEWGDVIYAPYFCTLRLSVAATWWIVGNWYTSDPGEVNSVFSALLAGTRKRTGTQVENSGLQDLVERIRDSDALTRALKDFSDGAFFEHLETFEEGREFLGHYRPWLATFGHRGHSDRDYWYPRRSEDPSIDYRAFQVMLQSEPGHIERREAELNAAREATADKIRAHLAALPGGEVKEQLFTAAHSLAIDYMAIRDDERFRPTDSLMHAYKRGALVLGERLHERGLLDEVSDVWFLADWELYDVVEGRQEMTPLLRAKISARRRDGQRTLDKTANLPMHLRRNRPVDLEHATQDGADGVHRGSPTSSGTVTGTARVLADHHEMGRVARGEILVTHSTDPGWNPVFAVISAVVVETGGMLSHASCLAREYGFPAVFLPGATKLIADGATITVDGDTGIVTVLP
jgi:pyruvate,water dikinase